MEQQKYRCILKSRNPQSSAVPVPVTDTTTFFFAKTDRAALGNVLIFVEMYLGMFSQPEDIYVFSQAPLLPGQPSIVTGNVKTEAGSEHALTAFFIQESEYQSILEKDLTEQLAKLDRPPV